MKKLTLLISSLFIFTLSSQALELNNYQRQLLVNRMYQIIQPLMGIPYKFGGTSINGLDCSAFTMIVFRNLGIYLPRTVAEQAQYGTLVTHRLRPGDLIFFHTYAPYPSHVAIYLGHGYMVEASSKYGKVVVVPVLSQHFLDRRFMFAKRLF